MKECVDILSNVLLQVEMEDRWVWNLHSSKRYTVKSAYENLTSVNVDFNVGYNHVLWLKMIPLKFNFFFWRLILNQLPTKDLLVRPHILVLYDNICSVECGLAEDRDHLFIKCKVFGSIWFTISGWLGISIDFHGNIQDHLLQFYGLGGLSKNSRLTFNIIWISVLCVIWRERNGRIFQ